VRAKPSGLFARVVAEPCGIPLADGRTISARPGDVRIYRGSATIDVLSPERYLAEYEVIEPLGLALTASDCNQLDEVLGLASTKDAATLLRAVDRLGAIRIGDIRLAFTPGQLMELAHRAEKRGRTVEAEMAAVVARIEDELFYRGG
jgi:hypothetical protein